MSRLGDTKAGVFQQMSDCFYVGANDQNIPFSLTDEILITFLVDLGGTNLWFRSRGTRTLQPKPVPSCS